MKESRGSVSILYVLYGVLLFCLLLLIFFPYDRLAERLIRRFSEEQKISIRYDQFDFSFPLRCSFQPVEILLPYGSRRIPAYRGDSLSLRVFPGALVGGDLHVDFHGKAYGGTLSGSARMKFPISSMAGAYHLQVREVRIEDVLAPFYLRNFRIHGSLTGEGDVEVPPEAGYTRAVGKVVVSLQQGSVRNILIHGLDLPDFDFQTIETVADLGDGILMVRKCHIVSEVLLAEIDGEIRLDARDVRESRLNLTAHLKAQAGDPINLKGVAQFFNKSLDSNGYYAFRIQGTFRNPELL